MSYELVDAVNQQCELPKGATDLLILTKFAELVSDPLNPVRRIGLERFMVITRLDRRTVQRHLHGLHVAGLLECIDGDKVKGDRPKLYRLNLPEGFDQDVVSARRLRYYAGKPFNPVFYEDNAAALPNGEYRLPPVRSEGGMSAVSGNLPEIQDNLPEIQVKLPGIKDKLPEIQDKLPPFNNIRRKKGNNNNEGVVVDEEVLFVLKAAAAATGASPEAFASLGITSGNATVALSAIRHFSKARESEECLVRKNPVRYLSKVIETAITSDGASLDSGSLKTPRGKGEKARLISEAWQDFMLAGHKLNALGRKMAGDLWTEFSKIVPPELPVKELRTRIEDFTARFESENPDPPTDADALAAAIRRAIKGESLARTGELKPPYREA